ncbi:MAG: NAD(P)H-hydrate dehydratase [Acidobacteria bacterium]|nr:NAD(P)H-hydrate dehydratase [Acidobacteriota bacterium]
MKVLTAAQMREVDRRTIEAGIPGLILMENAGLRVAEFLEEKFAPLSQQRITIMCGKGNNGGDGLVVARQLFTRFRPRALDVVLLPGPGGRPEELKGDAAQNLKMIEAAGCRVERAISERARAATVVVDALLGTGASGPASGRILEAIREVNSGFPAAKIVALDIPSGLASDSPEPPGEHVRAHYTVTFTAPKIAQLLPPACEAVGELRVAAIGSPPQLYEADDTIWLSLLEARHFEALLRPRARAAHKGDFGHVLVIGGSAGKTGAAVMAGLAALRSGAGLATVASPDALQPLVAGHAPELMTEPFSRLDAVAPGKDVIALGPGIGASPETVELVRRVVRDFGQPMVIDADGLNALAGADWQSGGRLRVLTPHPGEMSRLTGRTVAEIQQQRIPAARAFAMERQVLLVLKGYRSLIAFPDGRTWINPTGSPALAKGGSGDLLTGMVAGFLGQFPQQPELAVGAAVYLHGLAGELAAARQGEKTVLATGLLDYLPAALEECARLPDRF